VTDNVCVSPLDYASAGIYLTTKSLEDAKAVVEVRSIISNGEKPEPASKSKDTTPGQETGMKPRNRPSRPAPVRATIFTEIQDAAGHTVAKISTEQEIASEVSVTVRQLLDIPTPHRWQGRKDPYLYTATVRVQLADETVDQVTQSFGLRTVAITPEQGFLLNGKPYAVHGVNRHQDIRNKGWAISPEDEENDARFIKEMGANGVRNAHYPQSENWHAINDREGVLLWDELPLVNVTRDTRAFWQNSEEALREMVCQLYNHPSVAWWGIFNELGTRPMPPSDEKLAHLQAVAKEIDPNRLVVAASCHMQQSFNLLTEQMAFNAYPGWYHPSPPSEMKLNIEKRSAEAGKRIAISEYGAGANIAHHTEGAPVQSEPRGAFHPEEYQAFVHEEEWRAMRDNPLLWGTFIWNMFDFAKQGRKEGNILALNDKGMVTRDRRVKKDAFFFYKANWNPEPMLHITSRRLVSRIQPTTEVKVYSNCLEVELKVNGKSQGVVKPDDFRIARWPAVDLQPGMNTIEATTRSKGKSLSDSCKWVLEPAAK
jgi:beta-galactosidase